LFEGIFFAYLLLCTAWRSEVGPVRVAAMASCWAAMALAPTLAAYLAYAAAG